MNLELFYINWEKLKRSKMVNIKCPKCGTLYRIPETGELFRITCKKCNQIFYNKEISSPKKKNFKYLFFGISIIVIVALIWFFNNSKSGNSIISHFKSANWVTISYSSLVDNSVLTHSGETVGEIIEKNHTCSPSFNHSNYIRNMSASVLCKLNTWSTRTSAKFRWRCPRRQRIR